MVFRFEASALRHCALARCVFCEGSFWHPVTLQWFGSLLTPEVSLPVWEFSSLPDDQKPPTRTSFPDKRQHPDIRDRSTEGTHRRLWKETRWSLEILTVTLFLRNQSHFFFDRKPKTLFFFLWTHYYNWCCGLHNTPGIECLLDRASL